MPYGRPPDTKDAAPSKISFVKLGAMYLDYREHGQIEWTGPAILFVGLIFTLTAPTYIWKIFA